MLSDQQSNNEILSILHTNEVTDYGWEHSKNRSGETVVTNDFKTSAVCNSNDVFITNALCRA